MPCAPAPRPRSTRCTAAAVVLTFLGVGCSEAGNGARWVIEDSAAVEVITSAGEAPRWTVSERPVMEVGSVDSGGPSSFYRISDMELLADGRLVVANQGSEELRIFGPDGEHLGSVGGKGHGPGEFNGLGMVESFADSLLTWDGGNQRISVRRLDGTLVRTFGLEWFDGILFPVDLPGDRARAGQRAILAVTARYMSQLEGTGLVVDTALVSIYDMAGMLIDSLVRVPHNARAVQRIGNRQTVLGAPYAAGASLVGMAGGTGRGFCHTFGPEPEIECREGADIRRVIRVDLPDRPVTEQDVDLFWEEALATTSESRRSALRRMRDMMPIPAEFPAFAQLVHDDAGRLWARRYRTPRDTAEEWLVFEDGRWISRLSSPTGFEVMDIRADLLAGVWRNDLGVEFVRVYRWDGG